MKLPPRPSGPIADYANLIDNNTELKLNALARSLWVEAKFGLIIATIPEIADMAIKEYAAALYREWRVGTKEDPEGVLVLLSIKPSGIHIEVGQGSKGYLNDRKIGYILNREGLPFFHTGLYADGLLDVSIAIAGVVAKEKKLDLANVPATAARTQTAFKLYRFSFSHPALLIISGIVAVALFVLILLMRARSKTGKNESFRPGFGSGLGSGGFCGVFAESGKKNR